MKRIVILISCFFPFLVLAEDKGISKRNFLGFVENKGQIRDQFGKPNRDVLYLLQTPGTNIQVKKNGFSYDVYKIEELPQEKQVKNTTNDLDIKPLKTSFHRIDVVFSNTNPDVHIEGQEAASDVMNFYTDITPEEGIVGVKHFKKVYYKNFYEGVDLELLITPTHRFKYNFYVQNEASLKKIKWQYKGGEGFSMDPKRQTIEVHNSISSIEEHIPKSYFIGQKNRTTETQVYYKQDADEFMFQMTSFSEHQKLCIDPTGGARRLWGTYYSTGSWKEEYDDVTVQGDGYSRIDMDGSGNIYMCGRTNTSAFDQYGWLVKFAPNGTRTWAVSPIGTGGSDARTWLFDVYVNTSDNTIYVCGSTSNTSGIATAGAFQTTYIVPVVSSTDAFIQKYDNNGTLLWGTYYGGTPDNDLFRSVMTDGAGNVFTGGVTQSNGMATLGAHQTVYNGKGGSFGSDDGDGLLVKFNSAGVRQWATYYGGTDREFMIDICLDPAGNVYIGGQTESTTSISTAGAFQVANNGPFPLDPNAIGGDNFVAKFNTSGVRQWGTYFGGTSDESNFAITSDAAGNIVFSGETNSWDIATTVGAYQLAPAKVYLAKFTAAGARTWVTYYGNSFSSWRFGDLTTDASSNIYICGNASDASNLTSAGAYQTSISGDWDAWVALFNSAGVRQWGTLYGGPGREFCHGIQPLNSLVTYISGGTYSTSGIASPGAYNTTYDNGDAYLVKLGSGCDANPAGTITWEGNVDRNWHECLNWNPRIVPTDQSNVSIPNTTNKPFIYSPNSAHFIDLSINTDAGATLDMESGANMNVYKCEIVLSMEDLTGDGWNGFTIQLTLGATNLGSYTLSNGFLDNVSIPITASGTLQCNITALGTAPNDVSYKIYTPYGVQWFSKTAPHTTGLANSANMDCGAAIGGLTCGSATFNPTAVNSGVPYTGTMTVPYTGGNGASYSDKAPVSSTTITGLNATLQAGSLTTSTGNITYSVTGTPSGVGNAIFALTFGGKSCSVTKATLPPPTVTGLTCGSATFSPATITQGVAYTGTMTVPYTGGNGQSYSSGIPITSTGVNGLTATLVSGTLANGAGNLTYNVSGTPTTGGTASFPLTFGGQSCTVAKPVNCVLTLNMNDVYGDGWNGFQIQLLLNGTALGTYTLSNGYSGSISIPISTGGTLDVKLIAKGTFPNDVSYNIVAPNGTTWFTKVPPHGCLFCIEYSAQINCP